METTLPLALDAYHNDVKVWKSAIGLATDELRFIESLTHSYIFEPSTPNLFERLELFKSEIFKTKKQLETIKTLLKNHDLELSGMMESDTASCDTVFNEKHLHIKETYYQFIENYNKMKSEIFNYCGGILKSNKKTS